MFEEFVRWSQQRMADCAARQAALAADSRGDEAAFMQIRSNVYGLFLAAGQGLRGDLTALRARLDTIPAAWEKSLAQAEAHGDETKAHIERIKLETAAAIRHFVTHLEEQNHD